MTDRKELVKRAKEYLKLVKHPEDCPVDACVFARAVIELVEQIANRTKQRDDFMQELERHATDRVNQRRRIAGLEKRSAETRHFLESIPEKLDACVDMIPEGWSLVHDVAEEVRAWLEATNV